MKSILSFVAYMCIAFTVYGQQLYIQTYGDPKDKPLLFLHGGPGYNSVLFERSTAEELAGNGFFVIVYDRRGEGRSVDSEAKFTFEESFEDILTIVRKHELDQVTLLGHSFGGVLGVLFAQKYPTIANQVILIGAPVSMQESFQTIIQSSKSLYEQKMDNVNLQYIQMLEKMDRNSLEFSSYCFAHAMQNGFYATKKPSDEAKAIYTRLQADPTFQQLASQMSREATLGFWKNEQYTSIDLSASIQLLQASGVAVYGMYGQEDGLFAPAQLENLKNILGSERVKYLENCSHNVFSDQQRIFIDVLNEWLD